MSLLGRFGLVAGMVAVAVFAVGCGETVIDSSKTEGALQHNLETSLKEKVSSVECPSDQKVEPKATFTCTVKLQSGKTETATLKILNDNADVSVVDLRGEATGSNE
jgi:Domain of unknown function (DUF4333)